MTTVTKKRGRPRKNPPPLNRVQKPDLAPAFYKKAIPPQVCAALREAINETTSPPADNPDIMPVPIVSPPPNLEPPPMPFTDEILDKLVALINPQAVSVSLKSIFRQDTYLGAPFGWEPIRRRKTHWDLIIADVCRIGRDRGFLQRVGRGLLQFCPEMFGYPNTLAAYISLYALFAYMTESKSVRKILE